MTNPPKKLKMQTSDLTQEHIAKLAELFPNCVCETHDENEQPKLAIDFDKLKQVLSPDIVEGYKERYQINWPGKQKSITTANMRIKKTLRLQTDESRDWESTENLFIEGDNLDALKLLKNTYLGKVKMIYIDPPYNTGNDFLFYDNRKESAEEYLEDSGQKDEYGNRMQTNTESNGRFHSDWLSMIYPRLLLAWHFLRDDGVIFISIDDHEQASLKRLCDEIFGNENVDLMVWRKAGLGRDGKMKNTTTYRKDHEYIIVCFKNIRALNKTLAKPEWQNEYKNQDNDPRGGYKAGSISKKEDASNKSHKNYYTVTSPSGKECTRQFDISKEDFIELDNDKRIYWGKNGDAVPALKIFQNEERSVNTSSIFFNEQSEFTSSLFEDNAVNTTSGTKELNAILDIEGIGEEMRPKPSELIRKLTQIGTHKDSIVFDFFAGSGTTAHAVMRLNAKDGGSRKFICVQWPEDCDEKSNAFKADFKNIAEIAKKRIRKAGDEILKSERHADWNKDIGFRVLTIDSTNMKDIYYSPADLEQKDLEGLVDNIKHNRTSKDLLLQVMLELGVDLTLSIVKKDIEGREVFFVNEKDKPAENDKPVEKGENVLMACFERMGSIDKEFCKILARQKPARALFRDGGFKDDCAQINVVQIFKAISPKTIVRIL